MQQSKEMTLRHSLLILVYLDKFSRYVVILDPYWSHHNSYNVDVDGSCGKLAGAIVGIKGLSPTPNATNTYWSSTRSRCLFETRLCVCLFICSCCEEFQLWWLWWFLFLGAWLSSHGDIESKEREPDLITCYYYVICFRHNSYNVDVDESCGKLGIKMCCKMEFGHSKVIGRPMID